MSTRSEEDSNTTRGPGRPRIHREPRRKVTWIMSEEILARLEATIPQGERGAFVEAAIRRALNQS